MTDLQAKKDPKSASASPAFVDLPNGIFTSDGVWFRVRLTDLKEFAAPVLARVPLEVLLADASAWMRSPATLSLYALLAGLLWSDLWTGLVAGLAVWLGWSLLAPGLVLRPLVRLTRLLQHPLVVGGSYVAGLSWLGSGGAVASVAVGLAWFVAVRWGVVERVFRPIVDPLLRRMYPLSPADQILRALIVRTALALRVGVGALDQMERRMMEIANRHRTK